MKIKFLMLLAIVLFLSCKNNNRNVIISNKSDLSEEVIIDSLFKPDFIIPIKIFGCGGGGFYTYDTTKLSQYKFIFLSDPNGDTAIIKIKGKEILLLPDSLNSKQREKDFFQEAWKGHGLSVIFKITVLNETGDEMNCKGTMEIKNSKSIVKFNIHGGWED